MSPQLLPDAEAGYSLGYSGGFINYCDTSSITGYLISFNKDMPKFCELVSNNEVLNTFFASHGFS